MAHTSVGRPGVLPACKRAIRAGLQARGHDRQPCVLTNAVHGRPGCLVLPVIDPQAVLVGSCGPLRQRGLQRQLRNEREAGGGEDQCSCKCSGTRSTSAVSSVSCTARGQGLIGRWGRGKMAPNHSILSAARAVQQGDACKSPAAARRCSSAGETVMQANDLPRTALSSRIPAWKCLEWRTAQRRHCCPPCSCGCRCRRRRRHRRRCCCGHSG